MQQIKYYRTFTKIEPINKGWSNDKKYYIEAADNRRLLLRVADISEYERKKAEFEMVKKVAALDVPMSQPLDFGICDNGKSVYSLLTWCDGEDAEVVLPHLTETEQYVLGVKSGKILKKIHSIPAPKEQEEWCIRFNRKTNYKIEKYGRKNNHIELISYQHINKMFIASHPCLVGHYSYTFIFQKGKKGISYFSTGLYRFIVLCEDQRTEKKGWQEKIFLHKIINYGSR